MAIGFLFAVLIIAAFAGCCIWAGCTDGVKRGVAVVLAISLVIAFICVPFSWRTVDTGEVAVVKQLGKAKGVRTSGTYYDFWMTTKYQKYDAKVQNLEIVTAAYSSDAQTMDIQMTLQCQVMSDKVMEIANQYGSLELLMSRIQSIAVEKVKAVLSAHKAMDIIANRAAMSPDVERVITEAIGEEFYVNVKSVVLTNIDFSDTFEAAVEEKMVAEQQQLKAEYENQAKIAKAEADAKAKIVAAEAESKASELLNKTLNEEILQKMYIEKWNGILPSVVAGESTGIMIPSVATESAE